MNNEAQKDELIPDEAVINIEAGLELMTRDNVHFPVAAEILRQFGADVTGEQIIAYGNSILEKSGQA